MSLSCDQQGAQTTLAELRAGDVLLLEAGVVPVSGRVLAGDAMWQSGLGLHSQTIAATPGQWVEAGDRVLSGQLQVLSSHHFSQSSLYHMHRSISQILATANHADEYRAEMSRRLAPINLAFTGAVYLLTRDISRVASLLQMDALEGPSVLAPVMVEAALHQGLQQGALFCNAQAFSQWANCDTLVMERSGVLTDGLWRVTEVQLADEDYDVSHVHAMLKHMLLQASEDVLNSLSAELPLYLSHHQFHRLSHRELGFYQQGIYWHLRFAEVAAHPLGVELWADEQYVASLRLAEHLRPELASVLACLRSMGVKQFVMLSEGSDDSELARQLGVDTYLKHCSDADKSHYLEQLVANGQRVAYLGDGVSDVVANDVVMIMLRHGAKRLDANTDILLLQQSLVALAEARQLAQRVTEMGTHNRWLCSALNVLQLLNSSTHTVPYVIAPVVQSAVLLLRLHRAQQLIGPVPANNIYLP